MKRFILFLLIILPILDVYAANCKHCKISVCDCHNVKAFDGGKSCVGNKNKCSVGAHVTCESCDTYCASVYHCPDNS